MSQAYELKVANHVRDIDITRAIHEAGAKLFRLQYKKKFKLLYLKGPVPNLEIYNPDPEPEPLNW